jgi:hypothetical protein
MKTSFALRLAWFFLLAAILGSWGCPTAQPNPNGGNPTASTINMAGQAVDTEPNDTFDQAQTVTFDDSGALHITGRISTSSDVDVYAVGPMTAGDRLIIDAGTTGNLDSDVAVFDEAGRLTFENDDRSTTNLNPFLNEVVRETSSTYFVAIAASGLADPNRTTGPYDMTIQVTRGGQVPPTAGQVVVLDFTGGTITVPGDQTYTVGPFDAGQIDPAYVGLTVPVEQQIYNTVTKDYTGLQLDVRVLPGSPVPAAGTFSRVLFGGTSADAFGISQDVDSYNANPSDMSIIFTQMFTPNRFGRALTAAQLGLAIGNVTSHEIGHLLGLNHVDNINDLMDTTGGPSTLLLNQMFMNSPLDPTIFPIGTQDGRMLLQETLGTTTP